MFPSISRPHPQCALLRFPILLSRALSRAAVLSLITGAVLGGCGKDPAAPPVITNSPPRITQLYSHPLRAHIHENIRVVVNALDPDRDLMAYSWTASRGSFPEGNQNNVVVWRTGTAPGVDTVTVHVQDYTHVVSDVMVIPVFTTSPPLALSFELGPIAPVQADDLEIRGFRREILEDLPDRRQMVSVDIGESEAVFPQELEEVRRIVIRVPDLQGVPKPSRSLADEGRETIGELLG